jgi:pyroglutamyl-peptidase
LRPAVRVLVTGFGPFPGVARNASAELAGALERCAALPGIELFAATIPVEWAQARAAARRAFASVKPHAVLHFGVTKRASGFEIETRASNVARTKRDQAGAARLAGQLARGGERILHATLPSAALLNALRRSHVPARLSRSAGHYLCNALYYWSLADAREGGPRVAFIHMPMICGEPATKSRLTLEEAVAGARVLIRAAAQAVLSARRKTGKNGEHKRHGSQGFRRAWRSGGSFRRGRG